MKKIIRFGKRKVPLELPYLLEVQKRSFESFLQSKVDPEKRKLQGLQEVFRDNFPLESYNGKLVMDFVEYRVGEPKYSQKRCEELGLTYAAPLYVKFRLSKKETGETLQQDVYLGEIPLMSEKGTFIINGSERVIVMQLQRSPGVYFEEAASLGRGVSYIARIIPERGSWLDMEQTRDGLLYLRVNRRAKFTATLFLRGMGAEPEEVLKEFSHPEDRKIVEDTFRWDREKDKVGTREEAIVRICQRLRPGRSPIFDSVKEMFEELFLSPRSYDLGRAGRHHLDRELRVDEKKRKEKFKKLGLGEEEIYQRLRVLSPEDIIGVIKKLLWLNREKIEVPSIDHLGNRRVRAVGELLAEQYRIALARLSRNIKQRMSILESEKITPRTLVSVTVISAVIDAFFNTGRLSQYLDQTNPLAELTHKRRLSALGPGGLTREQAKMEVRDVHYTHYGRICPIETPEGQNIGLITSLSTYARVNELGFLETPYRRVKNGKATQEIVYFDAREEEKHYIAGADTVDEEGNFLGPELIARYQGEIVAIPNELVEFVDVSPKQIVSVTTSLIPFLEHDDANRALMGSNMQRQAVPLESTEAPLIQTGMEERVAKDAGVGIRCREDGEVVGVEGEKIVVKTEKGNLVIYKLEKFKRSNQSTCFNQRPVVKKGDKVKKGDLLADGPSLKDGKLALGRNVLVAFMPWEGYNFEDAIVVSEKLVKEDLFTSIHIEEFEIEAKELKTGVEEITSDIPNVDESSLRNLDKEGIIRVGAEVKPGDILVGKVTPQAEPKLTPEEKLLRSIFGEKARTVKDSSLKVPPGVEGKVIGVRVFSRENKDELPLDVIKRVKVWVAIRRKIGIGDKMAGRHGNKGVIAKVLPEEDMPYLPDGTPVEVVLNPLGVPSRMNVGQVFETHLGWVAKTLGVEIISPVFEGPKTKDVSKLLKKAGLPERGKVTLRDGRTGEPFHSPITVGYMYMMKLIHLAEEKIHARSTGPYALVTQQPLGGKSRFGGQRFGEMEVWALEGYGAAYTLKEMITVKSDDLYGRTRIYEGIIKGENFLDTRAPESFKVLVKELQALGFSLEFWKDGEKLSILEMEKEEES